MSLAAVEARSYIEADGSSIPGVVVPLRPETVSQPTRVADARVPREWLPGIMFEKGRVTYREPKVEPVLNERVEANFKLSSDMVKGLAEVGVTEIVEKPYYH